MQLKQLDFGLNQLVGSIPTGVSVSVGCSKLHAGPEKDTINMKNMTLQKWPYVCFCHASPFGPHRIGHDRQIYL